MQGTKSNSDSDEKHSHFKVFDFSSDGRDEICSFEETRVEKSRREKKTDFPGSFWTTSTLRKGQNQQFLQMKTPFSLPVIPLREIVMEVIELVAVEGQKL